MSWNNIKDKIKALNERDLQAIIQDLYKLNPANKRYLESRFIPQNRLEILDDIKKKLSAYTDKHHKQRECRALINEYKKASSDLIGYIDLCAYHASCVADFILNYGECGDDLANAGITSFKNACASYMQLPDNLLKQKAYFAIKHAYDNARNAHGWLYDSYNDYFSDIKDLEA